MINLIPDELVRAAFQMACYGFAAVTAFVTCLMTPRW
jgi:hypothetical protein